MHRLVPDFIIKQYAAGNKSGSFRAAGLFVDISGFSAITDALMAHGQHGAEVLATLLGAVYEPLVQSVYEQGGFIATLAGDSYTALFPFDRSPADGRRRALAAAWRVQQHMAAMAEQTTAYGAFSLTVKVGLADGDVSWGIVSSEDGTRAAFFFRGTAVDGCVAAEHLAGPGDIVLTPDLYESVQPRVANAKALDHHYRLTSLTASLPAPVPVELTPVDLNIMSRFFPSALVTQLHEGEFRHVVNLFISLPTVRTEAQLAMFMRSLFTLQDQYGGLLNRLDFGDKGSHLVLFWGAPVAYENDIERALNFILELQTKTSIPINAGVTYRISHAGFIGAPLRVEYTCIGRGVNLAARFMSTASRGEIWLDEGIARRAEPLFDIEFEGAMAFKGFAEPQRVYVLYERKEEVETFYQGELVGREAELAQLADFVAPLWEGNYAGALVVWGEAGIGKSRLVHTFQREFDSISRIDGSGTQVRWFLCQTHEILRESLNPFRYWLRRFFGQSEAQTEARNKRSFNRTLDRLIDATDDAGLAGELDRTRSFLGALVDLRWPDSLYEQLDPQGRYENTLIGLISLVQAESARQPVVMHLEDAHWLDEDSQAFLARLARALVADERKTYPVALIVTARPQVVEPLFGEGLAYREIELTGLSDAGLARLAETQLGGPAEPALLALLAQRAEGNPFFAEQILRYLQETEALAWGADGWGVAGVTQASALPIDVRAVLIARLDRLAQEVKEVVQTAAVLGREFEIQLLSRMLQDDALLRQKVAQAERAAIWSALSQRRYLFKHALLRDAAYRMQVRARRQALHRLAVEGLESLYAAELRPHYVDLAHHAEQAGMVKEARHYLQRAGDAARDAYQNSQALDYYGRALALAPEDALQTRWELLLAREKINDLLGKREAQRADLERLTALAEALVDPATGLASTQRTGRIQRRVEAALRWANYALERAEYAEGSQAAQSAIGLARDAGDHKGEASAQMAFGRALYLQGEYAQAWEHVAEALALAQAAGQSEIIARSLHNLGNIRYLQGRYDEARSYYEQSLVASRERGDRRSEAAILFNLGLVAGAQKGFGASQGYVEQAMEIYREIGDRSGMGFAVGGLSGVAQERGDYITAQGYARQALAISREINDGMREGETLAELASLAETQGDYATARVYAEQAVGIVHEIGHRALEGYALTVLGHAKLGLGQVAEATTTYQQALEIRRELGQYKRVIIILAGQARAALAQDDPVAALRYVEEILAYVEKNGFDGVVEPLRVYLTCYQALEANQDPRAGEILSAAYALLQEQAAQLPDEDARRMFLNDVPWHRDLVAAYDRSSTEL